MKTDTTNIIMVAALGVGVWWLLKKQGNTTPAPVSPGPVYVPQPIYIPSPSPAPITPTPSPSPSPAPTLSPQFDLNQFLSQVGQAALRLFPNGAPSITPTTTFGFAQQGGYNGNSFGQIGPAPVFSVDFSKYGNGYDLFTPGEVSLAG